MSADTTVASDGVKINGEDELDIVQEVIDGYKQMLRRFLPEPCSPEDAQRIMLGEQPTGSMGLRYIADRYGQLARLTRSAALKDSTTPLGDQLTPMELMLQAIKTASAEDLGQLAGKEADVIDRIQSIARLANTLPDASAIERLRILYNIQVIFESALYAYNVEDWDVDVTAFYGAMQHLVNTEQ